MKALLETLLAIDDVPVERVWEYSTEQQKIAYTGKLKQTKRSQAFHFSLCACIAELSMTMWDWKSVFISWQQLLELSYSLSNSFWSALVSIWLPLCFLAHYSRKETLELDLLHFHFYINTNFTEVNEITLTSGDYLRRIIECILSLSFDFFVVVL